MPTRLPAVSWPRLSPLLPAAAMLALGCWRLGRPSIVNVEGDTIFAAHLSLSQLRNLVSHVDLVHGLYYLLMHFWVLFGSSLVWLRLPSVIAGAVAAACVTEIGRRLGGVPVGLLAGATYVLLPIVGEYSQLGRSYQGVSTLVAVSLLLLLRALQRPTRTRRWIAYGALLVFLGWLHEMTLLLMPAVLITLVLARVGWKILLRWAVTSAVAALLVAPILYLSSSESKAIDYLRPATPRDVGDIFDMYFGPPAVHWVTSALALVAVSSLLWARGRGVNVARLAAPVALVPVTILMVESNLGTPYYDRRYIIYGAIGAALLVGQGLVQVLTGLRRLTRRPASQARLAGTLVAAALVLALAIGVWPVLVRDRTVAGRGVDYGAAAALLTAQRQPGDAILYADQLMRDLAFGYPSAVAPLRDIGVSLSPAQDGTLNGRAQRASVIAEELRTTDRVWLVFASGSLARYEHTERTVARELREHFTRTENRDFNGLILDLYVRRT